MKRTEIYKQLDDLIKHRKHIKNCLERIRCDKEKRKSSFEVIKELDNEINKLEFKLKLLEEMEKNK